MKIIKTNPEFGIELALVVPYAYYLHLNNKLDKVITSKGMKPFYYFCNNIEEKFTYRTIDNKAAGLDFIPNNWIHGIDPINKPGVLNYDEWVCPPYKEYYKNNEFKYDVFITNKYNLEHGEEPFGYFDIECLYNIFEYLSNKGYKVVYKRSNKQEKDYTIDQNEQNSILQGYNDIKANVEGIGEMNDYELTKYFKNVFLFEDIAKNSPYSYNETQLRIMANCDKFISVCGGNSIFSSLFGGTVISYIHKGKELRPNYFGSQSYFSKLSNSRVIPVYDVISHLNKETYGLPINNSGKNNYDNLLNVIKNEL